VPLPPLVQPGALLPRFAPKVWTISLIPAAAALVVLSMRRNPCLSCKFGMHANPQHDSGSASHGETGGVRRELWTWEYFIFLRDCCVVAKKHPLRCVTFRHQLSQVAVTKDSLAHLSTS